MSAPPSQGARLAAKGLFVVINDEPSPKGKKIGYLRLGGVVERDEQPVGKAECPGGWYRIKPTGFSCVDADATLDLEDPILRAVPKRADLSKPMPYSYGFVRAVLPLYLRIPNQEEQLTSEFKLKDHLDWWESEGKKLNNPTVIGANDISLDPMGVPHDDIKVPKLSTEMGQGELFGAAGEEDPIPWWLQGGRKIPNIAEFKVPGYAVFADRARRHTGLAFVGSFVAGPEALGRRFAITVDLRLAPATKVKPDGGAAFHGVALGDTYKLPIAFVHEPETKLYKIEGDHPRAFKKHLAFRAVVPLTGNKKNLDQRLYYETADGKWIRAAQINAVLAPDPMPPAAKNGEKWIDISIDQQTLVMWEGSVPVYATLVSTGQDRMGDPKTTKSTVRGTFRIRGKHVTTLMDSAENLGGSKERDAEYGVTKRRGEGSFQLQDVPWVQYFKGGYALHGAYWHHVFGTPRSHGCVNLSPIDAHRVFFWTSPNLPQGWHGVYSKPEQGTVVIVRE
jgi:lipoprotein-anchoring transpeptidase ErfK/SrfK